MGVWFGFRTRGKVGMSGDSGVRLKVEINEGISNIDAERWDKLVEGESPFLEYGFLSLLEETGCMGERSGWFPMIVTIARDDEDGEGGDELLGALPFYIKTNSAGEFVFDWSWADAAQRAGIRYYPKAVVAVPFSPVPGRRVLLAAGLAPEERVEIARAMISAANSFAERAGLSSVHYNFVLESELDYFHDLDIPLRYGMQYHWYNGRDRGAQGRYEDFDEFLSRFRSKRRANLRRERRKLAERGVTTRVVQGAEIDEATMAMMFGFYKNTVSKFFYGQQYLTRDFYLAVHEVMRERLHFVIASYDGEDFGGAFNMLKNGRLYGRYWGCTQEHEFAHFEVCMYTPIQWCIEHGVDVFEPGAGGEHKYERGFEPTYTYSAHKIFDPRLSSAIDGFLAHERGERDVQILEMSKSNPFKA